MPEQKPTALQYWWSNLVSFSERVLEMIFSPANGTFARITQLAFFILILVWGARRWGIFYSWGNISLDFLDWAEVTGPRYALLRDAL